MSVMGHSFSVAVVGSAVLPSGEGGGMRFGTVDRAPIVAGDASGGLSGEERSRRGIRPGPGVAGGF
jgi:hypothetical protein